MACLNDYCRFKGFDGSPDDGLMNDIEINLKMWLDWCFLGIGQWTDVTIPTSGSNGGRFDQLNLIYDPAFNDGQVWETPKMDWVYESGVDFNGSSNPVAISGVWLNNSFYPPSHATYGHYFDYKNGRVVFNTAISKTSTVRMNYSFRNIGVEIADNSPMWKELQYGTLSVEDLHLGSKKGEWTAKPSISRQQMPAVIVECVPQRLFKPYELGNGSLIVYQDVLLHIVAENRYWRNKLADIISVQNDKTIYGFRSADIAAASGFPLDYRGMLLSPANNYPDLVNTTNRFYKFTLTRNRVSEIDNKNPYLYEAAVRTTVEVVFGTI